MLGAIVGDIVGSRFEFNNIHTTKFDFFHRDCDFTDDTICTVAVADAAMNEKSYKDTLLEWCRKYPHPKGCYGGSFAQWVRSDNPQPYNSFGNGSAMRVSPVGWLYDDASKVMDAAQETAKVTHNHPEGIKGAQAVAYAIHLLRKGHTKFEVIDLVQKTFNYKIHSIQTINVFNSFNETCQVTVPQSFSCFNESHNFEHAIRLAVSIGGDTDTIAAIAGSIAEAHYPIPEWIKEGALKRIPKDMKEIVEQFDKKRIKYI